MSEPKIREEQFKTVIPWNKLKRLQNMIENPPYVIVQHTIKPAELKKFQEKGWLATLSIATDEIVIEKQLCVDKFAEAINEKITNELNIDRLFDDIVAKQRQELINEVTMPSLNTRAVSQQ